MTHKDEFKEHMSLYNIIDFYRDNKWWMNIILTILLPFVIFGWFVWLMLGLAEWIAEAGIK